MLVAQLDRILCEIRIYILRELNNIENPHTERLRNREIINNTKTNQVSKYYMGSGEYGSVQEKRHAI